MWDGENPSRQLVMWDGENPSRRLVMWDSENPCRRLVMWDSENPSRRLVMWDSENLCRQLVMWDGENPSRRLVMWDGENPSRGTFGVRALLCRCLPIAAGTSPTTQPPEREPVQAMDNQNHGPIHRSMIKIGGHIVQELCESRGGRPGLSVLTSLMVSVDVKQY